MSAVSLRWVGAALAALLVTGLLIGATRAAGVVIRAGNRGPSGAPIFEPGLHPLAIATFVACASSGVFFLSAGGRPKRPTSIHRNPRV